MSRPQALVADLIAVTSASFARDRGGSPRGLVADVIPYSWVDGPGNRFVVFLQGCNFDCLACHNPQTIPLQSTHAVEMTVEQLVERVRGSMPYISGVTVSGGEATLQWEFVRNFFAAIKADPELGGLSTLVDSNGSAAPEVWTALASVTDGVMVDLKALDLARHQVIAKASNAPVLSSIRQLASIGRLAEVRLLLIPDVNDSPANLRDVGDWLAGIDQNIPVRINRFGRHGVRSGGRHWAEPTDDDVARYRSILADCGLAHVI